MRTLSYHLLDVFTNQPFSGNGLAVCTGAQGISSRTMQRIARELNLSETTFVLPADDPQNAYRVRIFTPAAELPMAGHPTIGTTFVLVREGKVQASQPEFVVRLEEQIGVIPVTVTMQDNAPGQIVMEQPLPVFGAYYEDKALLAQMLSLDPHDLDPVLPPQVISCGVPFLFIPLRSLKAIRACRLNTALWERALGNFESKHVFVFTQEVESSEATVHSRMFAPALGIAEDPATGGASGPLGCYLVNHGVVPAEPFVRIVSEQGIEMGRRSIISIEIRTEKQAHLTKITAVRVGGQCVYLGSGTLQLADE